MGALAWVVRRLSESKDAFNDIEVFVFGSVQRREPPHADIDLLVTYRSTAQLKQVQLVLKEMGSELPLDVIYMHQEEEKELDFVESQHCRKIFPP